MRCDFPNQCLTGFDTYLLLPSRLAHARQRHAVVKLYVASESGRRCLGPSVIRVQGQWSKDRMVGLPLLDLFAGIPFGRFDSGPFDQR